jgi:hypothetical protein
VISVTCMPSPGRVSCGIPMNETSRGFSGSEMSMTYAPASGEFAPPFSGPAQSACPQFAKYA